MKRTEGLILFALVFLGSCFASKESKRSKTFPFAENLCMAVYKINKQDHTFNNIKGDKIDSLSSQFWGHNTYNTTLDTSTFKTTHIQSQFEGEKQGFSTFVGVLSMSDNQQSLLNNYEEAKRTIDKCSAIQDTLVLDEILFEQPFSKYLLDNGYTLKLSALYNSPLKAYLLEMVVFTDE